MWGLMHRKDVFGQDADLFRPERWLETSGEQLSRMVKVIDLSWGYGKYQCLGMNLARSEIQKVLFEVCSCV